MCTDPEISLVNLDIDADEALFACQSIFAEDLEIIAGGELWRAGTSIGLAGPCRVAAGPRLTAGIDPCALAPELLVTATDTEALLWITDAATDPTQTLVTETFPSSDEADYPSLWFSGQRTLVLDEASDHFLQLIGIIAAGAEVQTLDDIAPHGGQSLRAWLRFRHPTPGHTDSTLGLERFDLDLTGGVTDCDQDLRWSGTDCTETCVAGGDCSLDCHP